MDYTTTYVNALSDITVNILSVDCIKCIRNPGIVAAVKTYILENDYVYFLRKLGVPIEQTVLQVRRNNEMSSKRAIILDYCNERNMEISSNLSTSVKMDFLRTGKVPTLLLEDFLKSRSGDAEFEAQIEKEMDKLSICKTNTIVPSNFIFNRLLVPRDQHFEESDTKMRGFQILVDMTMLNMYSNNILQGKVYKPNINEKDMLFLPLRVVNTKTCKLEKPVDWNFKALSYRWLEVPKWTYEDSDIKFSQTVTAFEKKSLIKLLNALMYKNISYVWIDALCIKQDNEQEKQDEIKKMKYIYNNCETVVLPWGLLNNWKHPINIIEGCIASWFERVWTLQESILSEKVEFLIDEGENIELINSADIIKEANSNIELYSILGPNNFQNFQDAFLKKNLITVMEICDILSKRKCSVKNDKIFGSLGILGITDMEVNYNYSLDQCIKCWYNELDRMTQTWLTLRETYNNTSSIIPSLGSGIINKYIGWKDLIGNVINVNSNNVIIRGKTLEIIITNIDKNCKTLYTPWVSCCMQYNRQKMHCIASLKNENITNYKIIWMANRDGTTIGILAVLKDGIYYKEGLLCSFDNIEGKIGDLIFN